MLALGLSTPLHADSSLSAAQIPNVLIVKVSAPIATAPNVQQSVTLIPLNVKLLHDQQGRVSHEQLLRLNPAQFQGSEIPVALATDQLADFPPEVVAAINSDSHEGRLLHPWGWHRWAPWGYGGFYGYDYNSYYDSPN